MLQTQPNSVELVDSVGRSVSLRSSPFTIGRAPDRDLILSQPFISRRHAEITRDGLHYVLSDLGSRHGTFVNGKRIIERTLLPMDCLQFGSLDSPRLQFVHPVVDDSTRGDLLAKLETYEASRSDLEKLRWFVEAARELNDAGKVDRVLASLLELTLKLAPVERGYVFLVTHNGDLELALGMDAEGLVFKESATVSQTVMQHARDGDEQFLVTDTMSEAGIAVPESMLAHSIRSVICIPLRRPARRPHERSGRLLGMLYLDSSFHTHALSDIDHSLLITIAREATALIENAKLAAVEDEVMRYNQELTIAASIQRELMTAQIPAFPFASVQAHSAPCSAVGGDFFNIIPGDRTLNVVLVDVSGKGMPAAILASTLQGMLYVQMQTGRSLADIAAAANAYLCAKDVGKYATMILLRLGEDGALDFVNCGHVQPRLCSREVVSVLGATNLPVGLIPQASYAAATMRLEPGCRLLLVSDGFTEAEDVTGDIFGEDRLDMAATCSDLESVLGHMHEFCGAHSSTDDCTLVQIAYAGLGAEAGADAGSDSEAAAAS